MHILTVGSSVVDLFMSIDPKHIEKQGKKVLMSLGDKIPSEIKSFEAGGNGANNSVGLTRLEIPTSFYTYLGNDVLSREIEEILAREGVALVSKRGSIKNAPLHIILDFDTDRIILSHYEKVNHDFTFQTQEKFDFIFLNSIADDWQEAYEKVYEYATSNNIPIAFSPGSRQLDNLNDLIYKILSKTKIFFSNKEEAIKILNIKNQISNTDVKTLLLEIKKLGPEIVSITDGANGAYAIDADNKCFFIKAVPAETIEKTGAGDAYASGFFASYLHGKTTAESILWGSFNSGGVMGKIGAQAGLLTIPQIEKFITENSDYKVQSI